MCGWQTPAGEKGSETGKGGQPKDSRGAPGDLEKASPRRLQILAAESGLGLSEVGGQRDGDPISVAPGSSCPLPHIHQSSQNNF